MKLLQAAICQFCHSEHWDKNKPEVFLTAEETAKRLKVDRSTLWRWNKEGYLVANKVGSKVRYKLSDVERIQKGELI